MAGLVMASTQRKEADGKNGQNDNVFHSVVVFSGLSSPLRATHRQTASASGDECRFPCRKGCNQVERR